MHAPTSHLWWNSKEKRSSSAAMQWNRYCVSNPHQIWASNQWVQIGVSRPSLIHGTGNLTLQSKSIHLPWLTCKIGVNTLWMCWEHIIFTRPAEASMTKEFEGTTAYQTSNKTSGSILLKASQCLFLICLWRHDLTVLGVSLVSVWRLQEGTPPQYYYRWQWGERYSNHILVVPG